MNTWCSKNMGSLAEPCTEDIEPFMKTCKALCMVLWPGTATPVTGSANPVGGKKRRDKRCLGIFRTYFLQKFQMFFCVCVCGCVCVCVPSMVFLKLLLEKRSIVSVSYSGRFTTDSTSAVVGSRGTRFRSWLPGLRNSGPSPVVLHSASRLLYSSGCVQITCIDAEKQM